uniref:Uncharacterized protein n=1 Tax=Rhizophora mucronata TaxID=61149 RepID=A0A2P2NBI3_RHIMU
MDVDANLPNADNLPILMSRG